MALDLFRLRGGVGLRLVAMTVAKGVTLANDLSTYSSLLHNINDAPLFLLSTWAPPAATTNLSFAVLSPPSVLIEDSTPSWRPLISLSEA